MKTSAPNFFLRPLTPADANALYRLTSNPKVARFMRFGTHTDPAEAQALIEQFCAPGNRAFAVCPAEGAELCGVFAFKADPEEPGVYSLSTLSAPEVWNRGMGTVLLARMKIYARDVLRARRLEAYVVDANAASRRVLEKNGFSVSRRMEFPDLAGCLLVYALNL